uniref:Tonoplast intrinsic protein n=1 Tax=Rhizophora mucronata TaxID=61149 RepID=A0A2P2J5B9_RHIMU
MPRRKVMFPPMKAPNVTAGLTWPPEMLAPTETATKRPKAWAIDAEIRPAGVVEPLSVSLLKAIPDPWPAKTKIRVEMNSASAALHASGWVASWGWPMAMFRIGMFVF